MLLLDMFHHFLRVQVYNIGLYDYVHDAKGISVHGLTQKLFVSENVHSYISCELNKLLCPRI